jgi:hypothetical protein
MSKVLFAVPLAFALAAASGGCAPDVPANPTYTKDVAPILDAHCVRCHGADDMLHTMMINGYPNSPSYCYLHRWESEGDCTNPLGPDCKNGVSSMLCGPMIPGYLNLAPESRMPPPPSEPLNDWETDVITHWVNNGAPQ